MARNVHPTQKDFRLYISDEDGTRLVDFGASLDTVAGYSKGDGSIRHFVFDVTSGGPAEQFGMKLVLESKLHAIKLHLVSSRYSPMYFREMFIFYEFSSKICFIWQYVSINPGDGSVKRATAITRTSDDPVHWRIHALPGHNKSIKFSRVVIITVTS